MCEVKRSIRQSLGRKEIRNRKKGFTMVELMAVVIIVGVLAAAAVPVYRANIRRAIKTEAIATLGAIRSAMLIYHAEFGAYPTATTLDYTWMNTNLGVGVQDPHYFSSVCYSIQDAAGTTYSAECEADNASNTAPGKATAIAQLSGVTIKMDQAGSVTE